MNEEQQPISEQQAAEAITAGMTVIISSLIATHPDYENFQIHLAGILEVADAGSFFANLTEPQRRLAREYVEFLQRMQKAHQASEKLVAVLQKIA